MEIKSIVVKVIEKDQKKFFNLNPTPKIAQKGPKSAKKAPNLGELKSK